MTGCVMSQSDGLAYWERLATRYDLAMLLLGGPLPQMAQRLAADVRGARRVLELGAGTGLATLAIASSAGEVIATDYAEAMVAALSAQVKRARLTNVRCERANLYQPRWPAATFDAVVAANVLHLVPDLPSALAVMRAMLRPGGLLLVPTYCHDETLPSRALSGVMTLTGFPGQRRFTHQRLADALRAQGLRVVRAELLRGLLPIGYVVGEVVADSAACR